MKLTTKINVLDRELQKHKCKLPDYCPCTELRQTLNRLLTQVHLENGLEPELLGKKGGSTEPF